MLQTIILGYSPLLTTNFPGTNWKSNSFGHSWGLCLLRMRNVLGPFHERDWLLLPGLRALHEAPSPRQLFLRQARDNFCPGDYSPGFAKAHPVHYEIRLPFTAHFLQKYFLSGTGSGVGTIS